MSPIDPEAANMLLVIPGTFVMGVILFYTLLHYFLKNILLKVGQQSKIKKYLLDTLILLGVFILSTLFAIAIFYLPAKLLI